jgi:hypothetical protein
MENRRSFARSRLVGAHYVAVDAGEVAGYGAIEGDGANGWRVFVVMPPAKLDGGLGDHMLLRLAQDVRARGGGRMWMREEARDAAILRFAARHGFVEERRFAADAIQIVVLARDDVEGISPSGNSAQ